MEIIKEFLSKIDLLDNMVYDKPLIKLAYEYAQNAHIGQTRDSGEPFLIHPIAIANDLMEYKMDTASICAALLHDVVEDTLVRIEEIDRVFGQEIAFMVGGLTKLECSKLFNKLLNIKNLLEATSKDIRIIIIKIFDRLDNLRTLQYKSEKKQLLTVYESMNLYYPIANKLGIAKLGDEIADISLKYLDSFGYEEIKSVLEHKNQKIRKIFGQFNEEIKQKASQNNLNGIKIEIIKDNIYQTYQEYFFKKKHTWENSYNVSIEVNDDLECYIILGIVHSTNLYKPNNIKDHLSIPYSNGYKMLHTTILYDCNVFFNIQINTFAMSNKCQLGVLDLLRDSSGCDLNQWCDIAWIKDILQNANFENDPFNIIKTIKSNLLFDEIVVFTCTGNIVYLPIGATALDFAYALGRSIGNYSGYAIVDNKKEDLSYVLTEGQFIKIVSDEAMLGPKRSWLSFVTTSEAENSIKDFFNER